MQKLDMNGLFGLHYPASAEFSMYQLVTYMFMHGPIYHLFFNMYAVYMFGRVIENVWGPKRFLAYYMTTGIGAGLINILVIYVRAKMFEASMTPDAIEMVYTEGGAILREGKNYMDSTLGGLNMMIHSTTIGASGAVFGILLAFGVLFPNVKMYIIPFPFPIKSKYLVIGYGLIELFAGIANFSFDNVAHFAHLGGMLFGIIMVLYWVKKDRANGKYFY
jgi:membrane associated rhomboid family serine protease